MFPTLRPLFALLLLGAGSMILDAQAPAKAPAKAAPKAAAKAAQPPRPGLTSCAGKIEGRYSASNGMAYTLEFRSGKAKLTLPLAGSEELDCWMSDGKILLFMKGETEPMEIEINDDGTPQTPMMGEMTKKAK